MICRKVTFTLEAASRTSRQSCLSVTYLAKSLAKVCLILVWGWLGTGGTAWELRQASSKWLPVIQDNLICILADS